MRAIATLLLTGFLVALVTPAISQEEPSRGAMRLILDASGSMSDVDEDGVAFIDKAKDAVLQLVDALSDDITVGLRVYGHREPNTDPVRGCRDTELLVLVAPLDRDAIRSAVEGVETAAFPSWGRSAQPSTPSLVFMPAGGSTIRNARFALQNASADA